MNSSIQAKYRPSLTLQQIEYLLSICQDEARPELLPVASTIIKQLKVFKIKAQVGLVSPAFHAAPQQSLEDRLGLGQITSPAQIRKEAWEKFTKYPDLCTPEEKSMAYTYMYENDLMTPEQEAEFEGSL